MHPTPSATRGTGAFLASVFRPHGRTFGFAAVLALLGAALSAGEPLFYKTLFDAFRDGRTIARTALLLAGLAGLLLGREIVTALLEYAVAKVKIAVNDALLGQALERLHALPLCRYRDEGPGAVLTKVERGIAGTIAIFSDVALHLVPSLGYLALSIAVMIRLEWRLSLVVILLAPLPALLGIRAAEEQITRERRVTSMWTSLFARFHEVLAGIVVVKSFVKEEEEKRRFLTGMRHANRLVAEGVGRDAKVNAAKNGIMSVARVAAVGVGGALVLKHDMGIGTLVAFLSYVSGVFQPVQSLTTIYQSSRKGTASVELLRSILETHDTVKDEPQAADIEHLEGHVHFENVRFEYRRGAPVLRDVNLRVRAGETIAFVGTSGAGKSTLMALLQRFYDPTDGRIFLDGKDVRTIKQRSVRSHIGVVLRDGVLFSDTIRDNIAFGRPSAKPEEIERAARVANAHDFIAKLPDGYDTPVGERGYKLSEGERQRIAIARAILKNAPILVLDEATSALDAESEDAVREALARLTRDRTTFVIAHRLSTASHADRIVVFKEGHIVESGTHHELLDARGRYAHLVERQARRLRGSVTSAAP